MWQQWVQALLGLWVIIVPFIGLTGNALSWTLAVTGIIIAALGVWGATRQDMGEDAERDMRRARELRGQS